MPDADTAHTSTATDDHDSGHGHAPAGQPLGPVDAKIWAYAIAGGVVGLLVVMAMFVARGG